MANTTIETLTLWDAAVKSWEAGDHRAAIDSFSQIQQPEAKILFNIGSAYLTTKDFNDSFNILTQTVEKDEHLAIAYFQLGCVLFHLKEYRDSGKKFLECHRKLRGKDVIDYNQLGLRYKLYACEALHNVGVTYASRKYPGEAKKYLIEAQKCKVESKHKEIDVTLQSIQARKTVTIIELPEDCLFQPNKKLLSNIKKRDYLGEAEVIAAVDEEAGSVSGFDGPRTRQLMSSPNIPRQSVDHVLEMQDGSPKVGLLERLKVKNGDRKMSSPALMMTSDPAKLKKLKKPSPCSSADSSPSGTLEKPKKSAKPRSPFLSPKSRKDVRKLNDSPISEKENSSATEHSNFILKAADATSAESPKSRPKLQSGGFMWKGKVIPPPPNRPPPQLKSEKTLPALPGKQSEPPKQRPPMPPPKMPTKPRKETVSVTLHCHTDESILVAHGTKLNDLLKEACNVFDMDLDTVDLWTQSEATGEMERIDDDTEMSRVWSSVKDSQLELWCYGKS